MLDSATISEARAEMGPPGEGLLVDDITVTYRNGHTALWDASFEIPRGTVTALVGVNGSGKSTLFKAVMGFVPTAKGEIRILGKSVRQALRENLVAYVPQSEEVDWAFPVLVDDVVMMGRFGHMGFLRRPSAADHAAVDEALSRVDMQRFRRRQIGELSGGQRKRVFLARALAQDGQVILLDEPFTGVDVKTEEQIVALLRELRAEGSVDFGDMGLEEGRAALSKQPDLFSVIVETNHVVADFRKAEADDQAHMAGPNYTDVHEFTPALTPVFVGSP